MAYLRGEDPLPDECLFCLLASQEDAEAYIVHRGRFAYVVLNRYPYNNGHLMVVPYDHVASLEHLSEVSLADVMALTQISLRALREVYCPDGFNLGMNIGASAGAGVAGHVHLHVVPRWGGDTNHMTTTGRTRVIPECLDQTYERLRPVFERLTGERGGS